MQHLIDPASGRPYVVDPVTGTSRWVASPPVQQQPQVQPYVLPDRSWPGAFGPGDPASGAGTAPRTSALTSRGTAVALLGGGGLVVALVAVVALSSGDTRAPQVVEPLLGAPTGFAQTTTAAPTSTTAPPRRSTTQPVRRTARPAPPPSSAAARPTAAPTKRATTPAPRPSTTTPAPVTTTPSPSPTRVNVFARAGAFCSGEGTTAITVTGRVLVCSSTDATGKPYGNGRSRWRTA